MKKITLIKENQRRIKVDTIFIYSFKKNETKLSFSYFGLKTSNIYFLMSKKSLFLYMRQC